MLNKLREIITKVNILLKASIYYWIYRLYVRTIVELIRNDYTREALPGDATISVKWLTFLLRKHKLIDCNDNISSINIQDLSGNRGLVSAMNVIKIDYDKSPASTTTPKRPQSLILKTSQLDFRSRCIALASGHLRECLFYNEFAENYNFRHLLPKVYYSYSSKLTGCYLIIMEDLCDQANEYNNFTICCSYFFGNKIFGGLDNYQHVLNSYNNIDLLNKIFENTAVIHAKYWNDKNLLSSKYEWLKRVNWYTGKSRESWELIINTGFNAWQKAKQKHEKNKNLSKKLIEIIDQSYKNTTWSNLQLRLHDTSIPFTLTHGDFHASNMLFNSRLDKLSWVDWSEVGVCEPTTDLGHLMLSDLNVEIRRANEHKILLNYYNKLVEYGIDGSKYTFKMCYDQYRRSIIERYLFLFSILLSFDVPSALVQYYHDQLVEFINDHHSIQRDPYLLAPLQCVL